MTFLVRFVCRSIVFKNFQNAKSVFSTFLFLNRFQLWSQILGGYYWGNLCDVVLEIIWDIFFFMFGASRRLTPAYRHISARNLLLNFMAPTRLFIRRCQVLIYHWILLLRSILRRFRVSSGFVTVIDCELGRQGGLLTIYYFRVTEICKVKMQTIWYVCALVIAWAIKTTPSQRTVNVLFVDEIRCLSQATQHTSNTRVGTILTSCAMRKWSLILIVGMGSVERTQFNYLRKRFPCWVQRFSCLLHVEDRLTGHGRQGSSALHCMQNVCTVEKSLTLLVYLSCQPEEN